MGESFLGRYLQDRERVLGRDTNQLVADLIQAAGSVEAAIALLKGMRDGRA